MKRLLVPKQSANERHEPYSSLPWTKLTYASRPVCLAETAWCMTCFKIERFSRGFVSESDGHERMQMKSGEEDKFLIIWMVT